MRLLGSSLAFAAVAAAQSSTLIPTPSPSSSPLHSEACAKASRLYELSSKEVIPAKYAYDCLKSVPVAVDDDKDLIDQLKLYWAFHSETGYLKNPPDTWDLGPVNLIGELDKIKEKLSSYDSEFDAQQAIRLLTTRTGNYHLNYVPDILQVFKFERTVQIASVADEGTTTPKVYVWGDLVAQDVGDNSANISAITKINGENVEDYLNKMASREHYIDGDARYNSLMATYSSYGSFNFPDGYNAYEGPTTILTFENGTQHTWKNVARVQKPLRGVTDGKSFFKTFCTGEFASTNAHLSKKSGVHAWSKRQIPFRRYPDPVVQEKSGNLAGYFMNGADFDDIAVLKIISFDVPTALDWQRTVREFLRKCKDAGMKKLVIDLRENGGGSTQLLLDTFMQLFPGYIPFSSQRYRAQENFKLIGDAINAMHSDDSIWTEAADDEDAISMFRYWSYWNFVDVYGENFDSWNEFFGPHTYNDDDFTTNMRYNMSNSNRVSILTDNFDFLNPTGEPVFEAENVVMLTDGLCGSACASFHEELKNLAGVQAITVGGRPQDGPMQTVGGTKGGEVPSHLGLAASIQKVFNKTRAYGMSGYDQLGTLANLRPLLTRAGDQSRIQIQDQIRKGDESGTALQYIYEAADCRLYYTTKTLFHPEAMWEAAWSAYEDTSRCVNGSTNQPSSISGGYKPFGPGSLKGQMQQDVSKSSDASTLLSPSIAAFAVAGILAFVL